MTVASIIILTVIATLALVGIGKLILDARKNGQATIPWEKIRPIITEVITEAMNIKAADNLGYEALEAYAVNFVKGKIDESNFFTPDEKVLFSEEVIRSFIGPKLKELYSKG